MRNDSPSQSDPCKDDSCASGLRNRYYRNKPLRSDDYAIEQRYGIERRRLLNRAIVGWGVAYGYAVGVSDRALAIGEGFALDRQGRELLRMGGGAVTGGEVLLLGDLKAEQDRRRHADANGKGEAEESAAFHCLLRAHYVETGVNRIQVSDGCCEPGGAWNHVCEGVVFSLAPLCGDCPPGEGDCPHCGCKGWHDDGPPPPVEVPPEEPPSDGDSGPPSQELPSDTPQGKQLVPTEQDDQPQRPVPARGDRGPHCCLCDWVTERSVPAMNDALCGADDLDPEDGVPLACVTVRLDRCGCPLFDGDLDACTPRRLIKSNDLLFDLLRGCDLTAVETVSWAEHAFQEARIAWDDFVALLGEASPRDAKLHSVRPTRMTIRFTGPVRAETLTTYAITIRCIVGTSEDWREALILPVTRVEPLDVRDGLTREARLWIDEQWYAQEMVRNRNSRLSDPFRVEIELRGDLIRDCAGQMVDGNANGTPGGSYFSAFRVEGKPKRDGNGGD